LQQVLDRPVVADRCCAGPHRARDARRLRPRA